MLAELIKLAISCESERLVIEWRNARRVISTVDWGDPITAKANVALWFRLGEAESALMKHAERFLL